MCVYNAWSVVWSYFFPLICLFCLWYISSWCVLSGSLLSSHVPHSWAMNPPLCMLEQRFDHKHGCGPTGPRRRLALSVAKRVHFVVLSAALRGTNGISYLRSPRPFHASRRWEKWSEVVLHRMGSSPGRPGEEPPAHRRSPVGALRGLTEVQIWRAGGADGHLSRQGGWVWMSVCWCKHLTAWLHLTKLPSSSWSFPAHRAVEMPSVRRSHFE